MAHIGISMSRSTGGKDSEGYKPTDSPCCGFDLSGFHADCPNCVVLPYAGSGLGLAIYCPDCRILADIQAVGMRVAYPLHVGHGDHIGINSSERGTGIQHDHILDKAPALGKGGH